MDVGRINHRTGIAMGFNPTDYYKAKVSIDDSDIDARSRSNNRLGALGFRFEKSLTGGAYTIFASPEVSVEDDTFGSDKAVTGLHLHQSNFENRLTFSYANTATEGRYVEVSGHFSDSGNTLGLSSSLVLTDQFLAYGEFSVTKASTYFSEYLKTMESDKRIGSDFMDLFPEQKKQFRAQAAFGVSYTSKKQYRNQCRISLLTAWGFSGGE